MAKLALINREEKRRKMVAQYEALYEPDATTAHRAQTCQPETLARTPG